MRTGALAALAVFLWSGTGQAHELLRTTSQTAVHWRQSTITLGPAPDHGHSARLPEQSIVQAIEEAARAWNALPEMRLAFTPPHAHGDNQPPAIRIEFCKDIWRYQAGLLATTSFNADVDTGEIKAAVITVNECDYKFVGPDEVAPDHFDLQAVITHELGHVLGLGHSDDVNAVMFKNTGSVRQRRPQPDDRQGIAALYGPPATSSIEGDGADGAQTPAPTQGNSPRMRTGSHTRALPDPLTGQVPVATELDWPVADPAAPNPVRPKHGKTPGPPPLAKPSLKNDTQVPNAPSTRRPPRDTLTLVPIGNNDGLILYTLGPVLLPEVQSAGTPNATTRGRRRADKSAQNAHRR